MGDRKRIRDGIKYGMIYTLGIMLIGLLVLEIFAEPLAAIFGLSGKTQELCVSAMRVISLAFLFAGANVAFQGIFQAMDGGLESLVISVCRQFLFVLPVAWIFAGIIRGGGADWLVWTTFPIAELLSMLIALVLMKKIYRKRMAMFE